MPEIDWALVRGRVLLDPTAAHLNAGSGGPLPRPVFDRVSGFRAHLAAAPMDFLLREVPPLLWTARERLARFLGGDPHRLVLTTNATAAVNLVASSLRLAAPGEILLTDQEYAPMRWCWERAAARQGLTVRTVALPERPTGPGDLVDVVTAAMGPRTRLLFFSHVLSPTGTVLPLADLCAAARERGVVTVVDGAQGPAFTPLSLADVPCDYYAGSGHKWLLAPTGTGFLHFAGGCGEALSPPQVSWGYRPPADHPPDERDGFGSTPRLRVLECEGTRDLTPWLALPEAIDFQAALGHDRVAARARALATAVRERLSGRHGLRPATPEHPALHGGMTAFHLPEGVDATALRHALWHRRRIEVATTEWAGRPLLRVSTHLYNTEAEVERLAEALEELVGTRRDPARPGLKSLSRDEIAEKTST
ncbi:aminotransferase class V-fold PLP-dependent enzyme [Saccharothrix sp. BKS2]|uniref:aminotransferase class V-fold PLP-dependent enzyme n=1 Tax=Saccharothrix sp. BKS2 TaxID=3064400 RepID=UPI0039EACFFC